MVELGICFLSLPRSPVSTFRVPPDQALLHIPLHIPLHCQGSPCSPPLSSLLHHPPQPDCFPPASGSRGICLANFVSICKPKVRAMSHSSVLLPGNSKHPIHAWMSGHKVMVECIPNYLISHEDHPRRDVRKRHLLAFTECFQGACVGLGSVGTGESLLDTCVP